MASRRALTTKIRLPTRSVGSLPRELSVYADCRETPRYLAVSSTVIVARGAPGFSGARDLRFINFALR